MSYVSQGIARGSGTQSPLQDLEAILRSHTPLIVVETEEEPPVIQLVRHLGNRNQVKAYRWTVTDGMQAFETCDQPMEVVSKSLDVLKFIRNSRSSCLFVLLDFHPYLQDAVHIRMLKEIALTYNRHFCTTLLVSHAVTIPEELHPYTAFFRMPLPTADELRACVLEVAADWGAEHGNREVQTTNKALELLVRNLAGLTLADARRLARKAIEDDGVISLSDLPEVMKAKFELLGQDGVLSYEYETADFSEVGGLGRLRKWLEQRRVFFGEARSDLDPPRGLLLLGVQGCGKSLAAKAAAGIFQAPLVRLDFGVLYNKYYGETERNLRKALQTAELLAPCVLWVDEIEKGIAVSDEDDGLSRRILGTLLTWMAERKKAVFIVATANDISRLPPELIRKGRFDEIFFVDLPSVEVRRQIWAIHLRKRGMKPELFQLDELAAATEGFAGGEIEQVIVSAMYSARSEGQALGQPCLLNEIQSTRPLSVIMAEQIQELRDWASTRTVPCD